MNWKENRFGQTRSKNILIVDMKNKDILDQVDGLIVEMVKRRKWNSVHISE